MNGVDSGMGRIIATVSLSIGSFFTFLGCGGDSTASSSSLRTGIFIDAPVKGLHYKTATQHGFTDSNGSFRYIDGEIIEFELGTLPLGKSVAKPLMTPYSLAKNDTTAIF